MSKVINLKMVSLALSKLKSLMYQSKCQESEGTVERKGENICTSAFDRGLTSGINPVLLQTHTTKIQLN